MAVFQVTAYNEATRKPLEEVRDEVVETIRSQRAETIVFNRAERLLAAVDGGEEFRGAAEAAGAEVSPPTLLTRQQEDVDQAVAAQVFLAAKPTIDSPVRGMVANVEGGYTVFSLDAVLPGRPESIPLAERDAGPQGLDEERLRAGGHRRRSLVLRGLCGRCGLCGLRAPGRRRCDGAVGRDGVTRDLRRIGRQATGTRRRRGGLLAVGLAAGAATVAPPLAFCCRIARRRRLRSADVRLGSASGSYVGSSAARFWAFATLSCWRRTGWRKKKTAGEMTAMFCHRPDEHATTLTACGVRACVRLC